MDIQSVATRLVEVGRKISAAREAKLRSAVDALITVLSELETEITDDTSESAVDITGDTVPLIEADIREATATLKLIQPGWGSSGYYSPHVLRRAAPVFSAGTKMFWDHQTPAEEASRPEGSLDRLAAELTEDAHYLDDGPAGPGLYARAKVFERYQSAVKDMAPHIGVSIRAAGMTRPGEADGRKGPIVERIAAAKSVDFVTVPGAGGQILQLFESAGRRAAAITSKETHTMTEEQMKALIAAEIAPIRESLKAAETQLAETNTENARLCETIALQSARDYVARKLATIDGLPQITKQRLTETLPAKATVKDGKLDEAALAAIVESAATAEAEYLTAAGVRTKVNGMGGSTGSNTVPDLAESRKVIEENLKRLRS